MVELETLLCRERNAVHRAKFSRNELLRGVYGRLALRYRKMIGERTN